MAAQRRRVRALGALLFALGAGVSELVAVQAVLADAPITAALLHMASALLVGASVLAREAGAARTAHRAVLRATLLSLCAPLLGSIAVTANGMPALRRNLGTVPARRALRLRADLRLQRDDVPHLQRDSRSS